MCLIIHRLNGANVPNDILNINRTRNPDGFGISWRDKDGLRYKKFGPKEYEPFHDLLKQIDRKPSIEYTAHYRFATTGAPCRDLSHPFVYSDPDPEVGEVHVFHNGVINIRADKGESDTSQFVKDVLAKLPSKWWEDDALTFLVESAIGGSRLLVMTKDETVRLDGGKSWQKQGGIWYSTSPKPSYTYHGQKFTPKQGTDTTVKYLPATASGKSASDSWEAFEPDDDDTAPGWYHQGHWVEAIDDVDLSTLEDVAGQAMCTECNTLGEFYIIGGTEFIEVPHRSEDDDTDSDEDALSIALTINDSLREVYN